MKKLLALLLCVVMVASVLVGCVGGEDAGEATVDIQANIGKKAPEGYTIKIGIPANSSVTDFENNAFTKWLEAESGYNIEIVKYGVNADDYKAQIASDFMVPGYKMPDILWGMHLGLQAIEDYGNEGKIYDLSPYFNNKELSGQWWDALNEIEDKTFVDYAVDKLYADNRESIYGFPYIEYCTYDMIRHQAWINQDWLDALDLDMPKSTEDLYNVLVKFRDGDPNGNGDTTDEIPMIGRVVNYGDIVNWIVNMFCYMDDARMFRVDENGVVSGNYWSDEYREALIFMNKLVKEGLMPDTIFSMTSDDLSYLVNPINGVDKVGIWLGHPSLVLADGSEVVNNYVPVDAWGYEMIDIGNAYMTSVVTKDCQYPDAAWEIFMLMSSKEGTYRMRYGEKGVDWIDAAEGTKSFTGQDAEINVLNQATYGGINAQTWGNVSACLGVANENERTELSDNVTGWNRAKLEMMGKLYKVHWDAYEAQGGMPEGFLMPLIYTTDEDQECSSWRNNTTNYYKSSRASFIKGTGELNDPSDPVQWQKYIDGFAKVNYYDWLEVVQDIYDATKDSK